MFRLSAIVLALVLSGQSLWMAFIDHTMSTDAALLRLLIAIPVAGVLIGILRMVTDHRHARPAKQNADPRLTKQS
jgi:hypothetical protein